ncbi:hypothetical protein B0H13DRAFT_1884172 [Mycena leptocephala]|nr:hypothetical protein B0H13DRAFT_1884172 [Mycena leptocephala]
MCTGVRAFQAEPDSLRSRAKYPLSGVDDGKVGANARGSALYIGTDKLMLVQALHATYDKHHCLVPGLAFQVVPVSEQLTMVQPGVSLIAILLGIFSLPRRDRRDPSRDGDPLRAAWEQNKNQIPKHLLTPKPRKPRQGQSARPTSWCIARIGVRSPLYTANRTFYFINVAGTQSQNSLFNIQTLSPQRLDNVQGKTSVPIVKYFLITSEPLYLPRGSFPMLPSGDGQQTRGGSVISQMVCAHQKPNKVNVEQNRSSSQESIVEGRPEHISRSSTPPSTSSVLKLQSSRHLNPSTKIQASTPFNPFAGLNSLNLTITYLNIVLLQQELIGISREQAVWGCLALGNQLLATPPAGLNTSTAATASAKRLLRAPRTLVPRLGAASRPPSHLVAKHFKNIPAKRRCRWSAPSNAGFGGNSSASGSSSFGDLYFDLPGIDTPPTSLVSISRDMIVGRSDSLSSTAPYEPEGITNSDVITMSLTLEPYFFYPGEMASIFRAQLGTDGQPPSHVIIKCYPAKNFERLRQELDAYTVLAHLACVVPLCWGISAPPGIEWAGLVLEYAGAQLPNGSGRCDTLGLTHYDKLSGRLLYSALREIHAAGGCSQRPNTEERCSKAPRAPLLDRF